MEGFYVFIKFKAKIFFTIFTIYMNINFTANFITNKRILKRNENGMYAPYNISVVELDKNNEKDKEALHDTVVDWYYDNARYIFDIYHEADKDYDYPNVNQEHFYAITKQTSNFDDLEYKEILGLMLFSETKLKEDEINFLQVKPTTNKHQSYIQEYKNVGKTLIEFLKETKNKKTIMVNSVPEMVDFYKKQNFKVKDPETPNRLYLEV